MDNRMTAKLKTWEDYGRKQIVKGGGVDSYLTSDDVLNIVREALLDELDLDPPSSVGEIDKKIFIQGPMKEAKKNIFIQGIMVEYAAEEIIIGEVDKNISRYLISGTLNQN